MTPAPAEMQEFSQLAYEVIDIADTMGANWETKYELIFSERLSKRIDALVSIDYCDPDTSYEEDVLAYVNALSNKLIELRRVYV